MPLQKWNKLPGGETLPVGNLQAGFGWLSGQGCFVSEMNDMPSSCRDVLLVSKTIWLAATTAKVRQFVLIQKGNFGTLDHFLKNLASSSNPSQTQSAST